MKFYIYERATYEVEADSPREALARFLAEGVQKFPCEVDERNVFDEAQNDVTDCGPIAPYLAKRAARRAERRAPTAQERVDSLMPDPRETARSIHRQVDAIARAERRAK
jgi:hypothetical protein